MNSTASKQVKPEVKVKRVHIRSSLIIASSRSENIGKRIKHYGR